MTRFQAWQRSTYVHLRAVLPQALLVLLLLVMQRQIAVVQLLLQQHACLLAVQGTVLASLLVKATHR
jgi:hypothetical protein